jgi:VWFA-related protein
LSRDKHQLDLYGVPVKNADGSPNITNQMDPSQDPTGALTENAFVRQQQAFSEADLVTELVQLGRTANRYNVTFYTVDPRGLTSGMPDLGTVLADTSEWRDYLQNTQDSLRTLAEITGGFAIVNTNFFDRELKRIDAEESDYYILAYYSNNPDPLKRVRKIDVQVKRPDAKVSTNHNQYILPAPKIKK